jgi:Ca2+-binding RTX toxin-like protein
MSTLFNLFGNGSFSNLGTFPGFGSTTGLTIPSPLPGGSDSGGTTSPSLDVNAWLSSFGGLLGGGSGGSGSGGSGSGSGGSGSGGSGSGGSGSGSGGAAGTKYGTAGDDVIKTAQNNDPDRVDALGGNDYVETYGGNDTVWGGDGNDRIEVREGNDEAHGGNGNDTLIGFEGNDTLYGDAGDDDITGEWGNDVCYGGDGNDVVNGGWNDTGGRDTLYGGAGNDTIQGGKGDQTDDVLSGGSGADVFYFGSEGDDTGPYRGFGTDTITDFELGLDTINLVAVHDVNKDYNPATGEFNFIKVFVQGSSTIIVYANSGEPDHGEAGRIILQNVAVPDVKSFVDNYVLAWPNPEYADF